MGSTVVLKLSGHLEVENLQSQLAGLLPGMSDETPLLVDAMEMSGYDSSARDAFIAWHRERHDQLSRVAIMTDRTVWHMVIRAMSLASRVDMRPFRLEDEARAWLAEA